MKINKTTLREIIKEELNNVMMGLTAPDPTSALEEAMSLQQEGLSGVLAAFIAALGVNSSEIPDNAKFNVNGNSFDVHQVAMAYDMLEKTSEKPEMSKYAELGQDELVDIVKYGLIMGDSDGDGIYGRQNNLKDMQSAKTGSQFGEAYADMALDKVLEKSQADKTPESAKPVDISKLDITKGKSPQGKEQLVVKLPKGKKLSQDEIFQITKKYGMTSSTVKHTSQGTVVFTAN